MTILDLLPAFKEYLRHERGFADNTVNCYFRDMRELAKHAPGHVDQIVLSELRAYQRWLSKNGKKPSTIQRKFACFTTFWRWLRIEGHVTEVLTERIQLPRKSVHVPRWLSEDELRKFVETPVRRRGVHRFVNARDYLAWRTIAWLGLRRSEIVALKIRDVLLDDMMIVVRGIKNRRDRIMPLPVALKDDFQKVIGSRDGSDYVFQGAFGGQWRTCSFNNAFRWHIKACGLDGRGITPHSLRHSFATYLVRADVNLVDVKELLGHVDIKSTMIYVHTGSERFKQAMDKHILNVLQ